MKKILSIALTGLVTLNVGAASNFKSPDILIDTKLTYDWSEVLVNKFRILVKNYKLKDPFAGRFPGPVVLNESSVKDLLPSESKLLLRDFGNAVGLDFLNAETKASMEDLSYDVDGFKTNLRDAKTSSDALVVNVDFSASRFNLTAKKISLSLVIPGRNNSPVLNVDIMKPVIRAEEEELITFFTSLKVINNKDSYKLQILKASFDQMASFLLKNPSALTLDYDRIVIPKVSIKIGNKTVNFSPAKIEKLIRSKHDAIKGILIAEAVKNLRSNTAESSFKVVEKHKVSNEHWVTGDFLTNQNIFTQLSTNPAGDNLEITIAGDACPNQKYAELKAACLQNKVTLAADSRLSRRDHEESLLEMKYLKEREQADIVVSLSEDYLNKLVGASYDAGLWEQGLNEAAVTLGPSKVILRLDKKGETATLIMDVLYKPGKLERIMTGSREIRFPLVLDVGIRIEAREEGPVVIYNVVDVDTSDETLINGRPEDGFVSTVKDVRRFKGKVAKAIRKKLEVLPGKDLVELKYPEYKGLGLEKIEFYSDGNGRMNAFTNVKKFN